MIYKVFLVEDEVIARESIRDNVDWPSLGFEFCGEASDGEVALPMLEATRPDVLITDLKMPFMDGLQLCKIVRDRMPAVKIIILSGHDEFHYAQEAVKLGVTEYLLKPARARMLQQVLQKVAEQLDRERQDRERLQSLIAQVEDRRATLRKEFLMKLVTGGIASSEAIRESQALELNIIAACYRVIIIKIEPGQVEGPFDYHQYQHVKQIVANLVADNPDIFLFQKGLEELVLLLKGDKPDYLLQEGHFLAELIKSEVARQTCCHLRVGSGGPQQRLGDVHRSFAEAKIQLRQAVDQGLAGPTGPAIDKAELLKLDKSALEDYLKFRIRSEFEQFFTTYLQPLSDNALKSYLVKNYIFVDIVLTTAKFVHELGGTVDEVIPEINNIEKVLLNIQTVEQLKAKTEKILTSALEFRDHQAQNHYATLIHQAKQYIDRHYTSPNLSLQDVAAQVSMSSSHFSLVFSRETGETFKDYLTRLRIDKAKELLRTTTFKSFEISEQIGYSDPLYFSTVFKKNTGFSPRQFRSLAESPA